MTYLEFLASVERVLEARGYPWRADQVEAYVNWCWWHCSGLKPERVAEMFVSYVTDRQDEMDIRGGN